MKHSKFTHSQIMDELKRVETVYSVQALCRELSIWRNKIMKDICNIMQIENCEID